MLYSSAHVSCTVARRGMPSQQFQVRTCVIDECGPACRRSRASCACICTAAPVSNSPPRVMLSEHNRLGTTGYQLLRNAAGSRKQ